MRTAKGCPHWARYEPRFCQMGVAERPCQPQLRSGVTMRGPLPSSGIPDLSSSAPSDPRAWCRPALPTKW